jgi:hypothetical protein
LATLADYLLVVLPHLGEAVAAPEARRRLLQLAGRLPVCSLGGLEVRLSDHQPVVDLFCRLPYDPCPLPDAFMVDPVWRSLKSIIDSVRSAGTVLNDQVRRIFIEFDLDRPVAEVPLPSVFLELNTDVPLLAPAMLQEVAARSPQFRPAPALVGNLDRCVACLPAGARLAHLGFMLSRRAAPMRVVIDGMPAKAVLDFLAAVGWQDDHALLAEMIDAIGTQTDPIVLLNLDVDERIRAKVGVEFYLRRREEDNLPRWQRLLDTLVSRGLAGPAKAAALLDWPGFTQEPGDARRWADNLTFGDLLLRNVARSLFWRNLNHVKLNYADGQTELKAYLGFGHNWFPAVAASPGVA